MIGVEWKGGAGMSRFVYKTFKTATLKTFLQLTIQEEADEVLPTMEISDGEISACFFLL